MMFKLHTVPQNRLFFGKTKSVFMHDFMQCDIFVLQLSCPH